MNLDIILEPDLSPAEIAEIAVEAERQGFRTLWHSNYHQNPDAFVALAPAALRTSRIKLGVLAISPYEIHPIRIANSIATLNEISGGRAIVAIGGGGALLAATGIKPERMAVGVKDCLEIVRSMVSGQYARRYKGEVFSLVRPANLDWIKSTPAQIYTCAAGPKMIDVSAKYADGNQLSDIPPEKVGFYVEKLKAGLSQREIPIEDFRIGNFWAWHIKKDREESMLEARRELAVKGQFFPPYDMLPYITEEERQEVIKNLKSFQMAYWKRSGVIEGVDPVVVDKLVNAFSSSGGFDSVYEQVERFKTFERAGLTELSIRLFDDPMESLKVISEQVMPHFERC
jgi:5,10-methylenetetrahydromethanopterin reductase